jgi:hypothetical protein
MGMLVVVADVLAFTQTVGTHVVRAAAGAHAEVAVPHRRGPRTNGGVRESARTRRCGVSCPRSAINRRG